MSNAMCHPDKPSVSNGLCDKCRLKRDYPKRKAAIAAWKKANPSKVKLYEHTRARRGWPRLKRALTYPEYADLLKVQGGGCAICHIPFDKTQGKKKRLCIDHNHETGKVRGLLCNTCNFGLGHFRDDPKLLQNAINYLSH